MGWMSMTPSPRPLRPAPPKNTDAPSPGSRPATDNPDLATPGPGLSDAPTPGSDIQPSVPTER
ncbi:hypothetical protein [Azospirillum sp.]|uniref:hypothetical protein n=1 Tax=Azospirillum sp. TaxID=34012 RepID=UPI003D71DCBD